MGLSMKKQLHDTMQRKEYEYEEELEVDHRLAGFARDGNEHYVYSWTDDDRG